jgi:pyrimidine deaminase RibD-like protein
MKISELLEGVTPQFPFAGAKVGQKAGIAGQLRGTDKAPKGQRAATNKLVGEEMDDDRTDYEIRNYHKLDNYLAELCELVEKGQSSGKDFGMVAAGVLSLKHPYMARLNRPGKDGKRVHAELAVLQDFIAKYGKIPEGTVLLTTLSPCTKHLDERDGPSCSSLVEKYGIQKVYCGYLDPTQVDDDRDYNLMETSNDAIRSKCKAFADTFLDSVHENFADGRHPEDKGDSRRHGIPKHASLSTLDKIAHQGGRKGQLAHWQANMRRGRAK